MKGKDKLFSCISRFCKEIENPYGEVMNGVLQIEDLLEEKNDSIREKRKSIKNMCIQGKTTSEQYNPWDIFASIQNSKKFENIKKVISKSSNMLDEQEVNDEEVDEDWILRFFDNAQFANKESVQVLWAHILAGEVKEPGRCSLRTLDIVRNVTKVEAELFMKYAEYVIDFCDKRFLYVDKNFMKDNELFVDDIVKLDQAQLVQVNQLTLNIEDGAFIHNNNICLIFDNVQRLVAIQINALTQAGSELLDILHIERNEKTLHAIYNKYHTEDFIKSNVKVSAHIMINIRNNGTTADCDAQDYCWGNKNKYNKVGK